MSKHLPPESAARLPRDAQAPLVRLHRLAEAAGATCLDNAWRGSTVKYRFRCAQGHTWERLPSNVSKRSRCPHCDYKEADRQRRLLPDGLARLQRAAVRHGGVCMAERYEGTNHRYRLQCAQGHTWEASGRNILAGRWCPACREQCRRLPDGLAQLQAAARKHGGRCLSTTYRGVKTRYRFECAQGHQWKAQGAIILAGRLCRSCEYHQRRRTLEDTQAIVRQRGGTCLSDSCQGAHAELHWQCHHGHPWHAWPSNVQKVHWCPLCACLDRIDPRNANPHRRYRKAGDTQRAPHPKANTTC